MLARHTLVWLTPDAVEQARLAMPCGKAVPDALSHLRVWRSAGWPCISARQEGVAPGWIRIGLPLPPSQGKLRLGFEVPTSSILRTAPPFALDSIIGLLPPAWRPALEILQAQPAIRSTSARVFGSAAMQAATGLPYLTETSDLDLLLTPETWTEVLTVHEALTEAGRLGGTLRLDGEIVAPDGGAVCWRELAGKPRKVMVKRHDRVELMDLGVFAQTFDRSPDRLALQQAALVQTA